MSGKIRDTKVTFHAKMGTIKDRNSMSLTKQKILRRGGKNTIKELYKKKKQKKNPKLLMTQISRML